MKHNIEFIGKFFDNHSLSIVNRNLALRLKDKVNLSIIPLDVPSSEFKVNSDQISMLQPLTKELTETPDIQLRHSYPPIWKWPEHEKTKVVYIQPWEFMAIPSEWQYKFDTFADAVITPSNWTAEVYKNSGVNPSRIFVVPNGYDESIFKPANNRQDNTVKVVYVGCHQYRKGIDTLLAVWSRATKKGMPISLTIKDTPQVYGESELLKDIITLQYKTGCAEIIYDDSIKSELEMAKLYQDHHIIIHPYRGEGFGMHIQEAMACGCIPIVTDGGPTDEFVSESKIKSSKKIVNLYDIFALKPEDSASNMGMHKWVLEPDPYNLAQLLQETVTKIKTISVDKTKLTTWETASNQYFMALDKVIKIKEKANRLK